MLHRIFYAQLQLALECALRISISVLISGHGQMCMKFRNLALRSRARCVCVCVFHFFYDDKAMGVHITRSQLDAAAPEFSFLPGDKPVNQPALSQTLVGHSVNVVRHVLYCSLVGNFISRHLRGLPPRRRRWLPTCATNDTRDRLKSHSGRETALSFLRWTQSNYSFTDPGGMIGWDWPLTSPRN